MAPIKVLAITTIRSDYDLMSKLYRLLHQSDKTELKLLVSGAHMSKTYGNSVELIEKDGLDILLKIETLVDSDSPQSRIKTASLLLQNSIDIVAQYAPDLIIYAGDREDVIVGALLGGYLEIPTAHFFGGDHVKDGYVDNPVRHATSKMSTYHFVSTEEHKERLLRMGELPSRVETIGSIALDKFNDHEAVSIEALRQQFKITDGFDSHALMIFHPISLERDQYPGYFEMILESLVEKGINTYVNTPNCDPGNKQILSIVDKYSQHPNFFFHNNLDRDTFLSIYKTARFIIGNSSSGVLEASFIPIPTINVGIRQRGRYGDANVNFIAAKKSEVLAAIDKATSPQFLADVATVKSSYGDGHSSQRAFDRIVSYDFRKDLFKLEDILELTQEKYRV